MMWWCSRFGKNTIELLDDVIANFFFSTTHLTTDDT
jgi:hypothetical protein